MKHEINCEIIRDLLPPYADGLASSSTRGLVDEHLKQCEPCGRALEQLRDEEEAPHLSPARALGRVKKQISKKQRRTGIFAALGAAVVLFGLFVFLINYKIPVKTPPDDLKFSVSDGVFTGTSAVDSQFTGWRMSFCKAEDGSDIFMVIFSMDNPVMRKILPGLNRKIYPNGPEGFWYPEHGMRMQYNLRPSQPSRDVFGNILDGPEYDTSGRGLWRVYFIQEQDYQNRRILVDDATGKLTEESMQYATLVWEETIA